MQKKVYKVSVDFYIVARSNAEAESSVLRATKLLPLDVAVKEEYSLPETELQEKDIPF